MNENTTGSAQTVDTVEKDIGTKPGDIVDRWNEELRIAGKNEHTWLQRAANTVKRYRDERNMIEKDDTKYNILWSNTETIKPALYARKPKPMVDRRNKDRGKPPEIDPNTPPEQLQVLQQQWAEHEKIRKASLEAAMALERCLEYALDEYDFDGLMGQLTEDYQLPGRGVAKAEYIPVMKQERFDAEPIDYEDQEPEIDEATGDIIEKEPTPIYDDGVEHDDVGPYTMEDVVEYEFTECRYVYWKDFRMGKGKVWAEVPWVAFRSEMDRKALHKRFDDTLGADKVDKIPLNRISKDVDTGTINDEVLDMFKRAEVWEIWDKIGGEVIWIAKDFDEPLDVDEPPINFDNFYPCNQPLTMVQNNGSMEPIPEYYMYQDQAREMNTLTARINTLAKALKLAGVYDKNNTGLQAVLSTANENKLIPIDAWSAFADKGGIKGAISWLPIEEVIRVMEGLYKHREAIKQDMYELTGIADIIRGASNPNETATAQGIKGRFAGMRIQDKQGKVARAARDLIRLTAEIICEQFEKSTIELMSGMMISDAAYELLKNDPMRRFRISIETDSTIQPNENEEKQARSEFLTASGRFMEQAIKLVQLEPEFIDVMGEMLMFGIRGFRTGRELEETMQGAIDRISDKAKQKSQQPQQQQQDPRVAAMAAQQKVKEQEGKLKLVEKAQDLKFDQEEHAQEMRQNEESHDQDMRFSADELRFRADNMNT